MNYALPPIFSEWESFYVIVGSSAAALTGIAAASILLLFIGIHNAWDAVTYVAQLRKDAQRKES